MSWIERIQNEMIITTGDGKEYKPHYLNAERETQFNVSQFDFVNKRGTLVHRGKDKGKIYTLELYFQGEDNIDVAEAFDKSTRDPRPWQVSHPLYDAITVQPARIHQDNTRLNVTKFTCQVIETITERLPAATVSPKDQLESDLEDTTEAIATEFENEGFTTTDTAGMLDTTTDLYTEGKKGLSLDAADAYFDAFKVANAAILNVTSYPLEAMRKMQAFINAPGQFIDSVENRLKTLENQYNKLRDSIDTLTTRKDKTFFEAVAAGLIVSMASATVTGQLATTVSQIFGITERIIDSYDQFITDLDSLQSDNAGELDAYIPNGEIIGRLERAVNFMVAYLKEISLGNRVEHSIILEEESNVITLTHRFYGLDLNDEKLNEFIEINDIGLNEMLMVRKGRELIYLL